MRPAQATRRAYPDDYDPRAALDRAQRWELALRRRLAELHDESDHRRELARILQEPIALAHAMGALGSLEAWALHGTALDAVMEGAGAGWSW